MLNRLYTVDIKINRICLIPNTSRTDIIDYSLDIDDLETSLPYLDGIIRIDKVNQEKEVEIKLISDKHTFYKGVLEFDKINTIKYDKGNYRYFIDLLYTSYGEESLEEYYLETTIIKNNKTINLKHHISLNESIILENLDERYQIIGINNKTKRIIMTARNNDEDYYYLPVGMKYDYGSYYSASGGHTEDTYFSEIKKVVFTIKKEE